MRLFCFLLLTGSYAEIQFLINWDARVDVVPFFDDSMEIKNVSTYPSVSSASARAEKFSNLYPEVRTLAPWFSRWTEKFRKEYQLYVVDVPSVYDYRLKGDNRKLVNVVMYDTRQRIRDQGILVHSSLNLEESKVLQMFTY